MCYNGNVKKRAERQDGGGELTERAPRMSRTRRQPSFFRLLSLPGAAAFIPPRRYFMRHRAHRARKDEGGNN